MGLFASPCTSTGTTTHSHRQRRRFATLALAALLTTSALAWPAAHRTTPSRNPVSSALPVTATAAPP